jgi:glycosyltransferase involved in cell wall biosynthesis
MKILHITNNFPTDKHPVFGIFVKEQIDSLTNIGIHNEVYFMNGREQGRKAYLQAISDLRKMKLNKYDIVHCHHSFSALIFLFSFHWFSKVKKVVSYQNPPKREGGKFLFRIIHFFFDAIILKINIADLNISKVHYLPNGVNTAFFTPMDKVVCKKKLGLKSNINYVLFMDSYRKRQQKRIDRFEDVIKILHKKNHIDIEPLVLTNTDRNKVPVYMNASTLHILTSDFEGSPNSVKECLSCNIPIVTTPVGNVEDMIGDVAGCYISTSFNPEELASLIENAIKIKNFEGREAIFRKKLDIGSVAHKLEQIYADL